MAYQIIQGQTGYMTPSVSILDSGWIVDGIYATHTPCNSGVVVALNSFGLVVGRSYVFTYTVDQYVSGQVYPIAGTTNGTSRTANGVYSDTLTVTGNNFLSFFSDGSLRISSLKFYDAVTGVQLGRTISFNSKEEKWGSEYSFMPEMMVKFIDKLFTFQNGNLWLHNSNPLYNNFYGVQYPSEITFVINDQYENNKLWYNFRLDSTGSWYINSMQTLPNDQFPNGMQTQMTLANVKSIDGKLWADILRDFTDPNFYYISDPALRKANALFRGRLMQGAIMIVTLQNDDALDGRVSSTEIYYTDVHKSL